MPAIPEGGYAIRYAGIGHYLAEVYRVIDGVTVLRYDILRSQAAETACRLLNQGTGHQSKAWQAVMLRRRRPRSNR